MLDDYISKQTVRRWLEHYDTMLIDDRSFEELPGGSPKEYDGIYDNQLNKIMLDKAVESLPGREKRCCIGRWINKEKCATICNELGISIHEYYRLCDRAVSLIYKRLNQRVLGARKLLDAIRGT